MSDFRDDTGTYRRAIEERFPQLKVDAIRFLARGADNTVYLVNEHLVFRFPRKPISERRLRCEIKLLSRLGSRLPLPVPRFSFVSQIPGSAFPFAFVGYELVPGQPLSECSSEVIEAFWWRRPTAEFLRALHAFPVQRARGFDVPDKTVTDLEGRRVGWAESLRTFYRDMKGQVYPFLPREWRTLVSRWFHEFLGDPQNAAFTPVLLHGDFTPDHVLLAPDRQEVTGVIDFADCAIGDPAHDVWDELIPAYLDSDDDAFRHRRRFYDLLKLLRRLLWGIQYVNEQIIQATLPELGDFMDAAEL